MLLVQIRSASLVLHLTDIKLCHTEKELTEVKLVAHLRKRKVVKRNEPLRQYQQAEKGWYFPL